MGKYLVCITGASGSIYGVRVMKALVEAGHEVHGIVSAWGERVLEQETGRPFASWVAELGLFIAVSLSFPFFVRLTRFVIYCIIKNKFGFRDMYAKIQYKIFWRN